MSHVFVKLRNICILSFNLNCLRYRNCGFQPVSPIYRYLLNFAQMYACIAEFIGLAFHGYDLLMYTLDVQNCGCILMCQMQKEVF